MTAKDLAYNAETPKPVPQAADDLTEALKQKGFGVIAKIDVAKIIMEKTGKTIEDYIILEVCNAKDASYALSQHKEIGLMLPCKIILYKAAEKTTISLYRPTEALKALGLSDLTDLAQEVEGQLKQAVDSSVS